MRLPKLLVIVIFLCLFLVPAFADTVYVYTGSAYNTFSTLGYQPAGGNQTGKLMDAAVGAFTMKTFAARIIRRFGFRRILIVNSLIASALTAACGLFTPHTPFTAMIAVLLIGGFFRSLQFTATNVIAYADVDAQRVSRATSLVGVAQQLSIAAGVAVGALAVELAVQLKGTGVIRAEDFQPAFFLIGAISATSALFFWTLPPDAGAAMANRTPIAAPDASDQRIG